MALFGLAISVGVGALLLAIGGVLLLSRKARAWLHAIPIAGKFLGKMHFLVAVVLIAIGLTAGGVGWYQTTLAGATASVTGVPASTTSVGDVNCQFLSTPIGSIGGATANTTSTINTANSQIVKMQVKNVTGSGSFSYNGTLSCTRTGSDIDKAVGFDCYAIGETYRSEVSTSDTNSYNILATTSSKSQVAGMPWKQTVYLNDGSIATTSSNPEKTTITFSSGTAIRSLGYYFTLNGDTAFNYLSGTGATPSVSVFCNGKLAGQFVIEKVSSAATA